jgi:hypothetical protein
MPVNRGGPEQNRFDLAVQGFTVYILGPFWVC